MVRHTIVTHEQRYSAVLGHQRYVLLDVDHDTSIFLEYFSQFIKVGENDEKHSSYDGKLMMLTKKHKTHSKIDNSNAIETKNESFHTFTT